MKNEEIKFRVSEEVKGAWQDYADRKGLSLSQMIRNAVSLFVVGKLDESVPTEVVPTEEEEFKSYFK